MDYLLQAADGINELVNWMLNNKELLAVVVGGSGAVSFILEPVKKWLALRSKTAISVIHYLFAVIGVAAHYIATSSSSDPRIIFVQALLLLGTNQLVYPLVTRPLSILLTDAHAEANVKKIKAEVETVAKEFQG